MFNSVLTEEEVSKIILESGFGIEAKTGNIYATINGQEELISYGIKSLITKLEKAIMNKLAINSEVNIKITEG